MWPGGRDNLVLPKGANNERLTLCSQLGLSFFFDLAVEIWIAHLPRR